ncbi:MAG: isocitrate dehydrogenase [Armatimonadota bacterium]|nr:MAG: isocitrate dehydrogenase [Armatimonadota bacterium]
MSDRKRCVVAPGDGIGPEITEAVLRILDAADAPLDYDFLELGESVYRRGITSGVSPDAWDKIRAAGCLLKGPVTTPQGKGFKSVNVTIRKTLNLFANVRPCKAYSPFIASPHPGMNLVIIRENEEDLYAGIEHRQTPEVTQVLKLVSRPGCEKIVRFAFEYARAFGRRRVTCMTKDNIMKLTDGLFHRVFDEISTEYPDIESDHMIIDIGSARLAASPETFDVIVTLNLYGDILSDIAAQLTGSIGLAASANIGEQAAMFEAVHGSAPDIAGRGVANPSGLLIAATQMLVHLGLGETAQTVKNAWLCTIEDGIHTPDIYRVGLSADEVGTAAFADAVIARLGKEPRKLTPVQYRNTPVAVSLSHPSAAVRELVGIDVFLFWNEAGRNAETLASKLLAAAPPGTELSLITNRGVKVYPEGLPETFCTDHWRCRFRFHQSAESYRKCLELLGCLTDAGLDIIKTENLYSYDGEPGFTLGQGE